MKKNIILIVTLALAAMVQAQTVTHVYHYNNPVVSERDGYQQIGLKDCLPSGQVGEPTLPWQSVSLILPQGQEAVAMQVELSDFVEMEGQYNIYPYQKPRPYSSDEALPFAKDAALYRSSESYPALCHGTVTTQYLNGVAFAFGGFTPVQYVPATGKVGYARTATVTITTTASRDDHSKQLWLTPENEASIKRLAQNEEVLGTYSHRGRTIGGYDLLVITSEEWLPRFGEYLDLYNGKGIRTQIVSLEEIYAIMDGRDEQEQIRNYIIQEYQANGISMVTLGGDVSIVPFRFLWCFAQEGYEDDLPADMYYACLDGTLNDDNDDKWGEVGEDDLLPELGIGRLPFNNENQFNTIMGKTLSYLRDPVLGEFTSPILGAEHLGDGYYGSDDMERLIGMNSDFEYTTYGYPTDYHFKRYYATPSQNWSGTAFKNVIGTGGQYVHHVGHANTGIVANWDISTMNDNFFANNDGINHNYMLFHSHGCICGDFSHACILERMVTITTGFVVTTGNSRYGWYVPWGDGMAAHIHREMVDAYCHDRIPSVGMAVREAKIATAPWVNTGWGDEGCLRWNIYCLNVIGDGALYPWFEEPITPDVSYQYGIQQGTTATAVKVTSNGRPLEGFRVSIYNGDNLLALGITGESGWADLEFDDPSLLVGNLELIVTGQSAWPQHLPMTGLTSEPFLYVGLFGFYYQNNTTGTLISGETYGLGTDITNPSQVDMTNVDVTISCDDEQIEIIQDHYLIYGIPAGTSITSGSMFTFKVSDHAIDQSRVIMNVTCSAEGQSWTTPIPLYLNAPVLQFAGIDIDDSMGDGNGYADPGEQIILNVSGTNIGHALAPDASLLVTCDNPEIHLEKEAWPLGDIAVDGDFTAPIDLYSDANTQTGTVAQLNMTLVTGEYRVTFSYLLTIGIITEGFESGDFSYTDWEHSGDQPWFVTDEDPHSGNYCARSGAIDDNEASNLVINVDILTDSEISFWLKTSAEYHKDYLAFFVDKKLQSWWTGETEWTLASFDLSAGSHELKWVYDKSPHNATGSDCAWIDDITFPRACVVTGVEETTVQKQVACYPNPSQGHFTLELLDECDVVITNLMGQTVMSLNKVSGLQQIQLGSAGMYLIQVYRASGLETLKVVVE